MTNASLSGQSKVLAIQNNARLMAHVADCVERAQKGPTKTLAQIKAELAPDGANGN